MRFQGDVFSVRRWTSRPAALDPSAPGKRKPLPGGGFGFAAAVGLLALGFALPLGCDRSAVRGAEPFHFRDSNLARRRDVALNDELWLRFSSPIDPARVTADSFGIFALDEEGRIQRGRDGQEIRASGEVEVTAHRLLFRPRKPLSPELDDGGFLPATTYYVRVAGFPRVDGLCALDGRSLEKSITFSFRTAPRGSPELFTAPLRPGPFQLETWVSNRSWILFDSRTNWGIDTTTREPWTGFPLGAPWYFVFSAPIRPDRIGPRAVSLVEHRAEEEGESEPILIATRLVRVSEFEERFPELVQERRNQTSLPALEDGMILEVKPLERLLRPYRLYDLFFSRDLEHGFADEGGNVLLGPGSSGYRLPVLVRERLRSEAPSDPGYLQVLYAWPQDLSRPSHVVYDESVDGAPWIDEHGGVRLPFTHECGRGELERLPREGEIPPVDPAAEFAERPGIHVQRIRIEPGEEFVLGEGRLHVLRSQGSLRLAGSLRAPTAEPDEVAALPPAGGTFDELLMRLREAGEEVVVLVAGGDVWIDGELDLAGRTLVLAGPTRVRLGPECRIACDRLVIAGPRGIHVELPRRGPTIERWFTSFRPGKPEDLRTSLRYALVTRHVPVLPAPGREDLRVSLRAIGTPELSYSFHLQRLDPTGAIAGPFLGPEQWEGFLAAAESFRVLLTMTMEPGCGFDPSRTALLAIEILGR